MAALSSSKNFIQAGGGVGGIVPQFDAPKAASNATERRVTIRCLQSSISLPVTPDTSPVDILYSSANLMSQKVDPENSLVVECYFSFGLERRLRRYERIRDVLNSWERDAQFSLLIVPADSGDRHTDLSIESVPRTQEPPQGLINFPLQHCQRPGKWNKRLVTLLETGQMYSHKKKDAKASDKDSVLLCNLSDFDLYAITERDMLKSIKAPKKHSFAIKSQQRNSVFMNTENFVHFFSSDDPKVTRDFQACVHQWRSWYLVNRKVDLGKKEKALHKNGSGEGQAPVKTAGMARSGGHRLQVSVDETPYTIGKFEPLMDMNRFDKPLEDFGKDFLPSRPTAERNDSSQHRMKQPHVQTNVRAASNPVTSPQSPQSPQQHPQKRINLFEKDEFKSNGLLGTAYEGRKQQVDLKDDSPTEGPFTGGLLERQRQEASAAAAHPQVAIPQRSNTRRGPASAGVVAPQHQLQQQKQHSLQRSKSTATTRPTTSDGASYGRQKEKPPPLLDIQPTMPEIPQAWREARGHGVKVPNGAPLISMATDSRTQWQRPGMASPPSSASPVMSPTVGGAAGGLGRSGTIKTIKTTQSNPAASGNNAAVTSRRRSQSTAPTTSRRMVSNEKQPPMPSLPTKPSSRRDNDEDVPLIKFVERTKTWDATGNAGANERGRGMMGRSGTLKYV